MRERRLEDNLLQLMCSSGLHANRVSMLDELGNSCRLGVTLRP